MTDLDELSSTEKLLDTIRSHAASPFPSQEQAVPASGVQIRTLKDKVTHSLCAGVYIGTHSLFMVLTGASRQGGDKELIKWESRPFPDGMTPESKNFSAFLKSCLSSFTDKNKKVAIWTAISTEHLNLRNLIIPSLHESKMANAALWGLKKEASIELDKEIFDYEYINDLQVKGIKKKRVVAFTGDKKKISRLKSLFSAAGFPLTGITAMPFAIENFLLTKQFETGTDPIVIINVRRYRSEIFCISDQGVMVARSIKTGSYSLVEDYLAEPPSPDDVDVIELLSARTDRNDPDFTPMEAPASRLMGKIQRTGEYCSNIFLSNQPISMYYFFGETDSCPAFMAYAAESIPDRVRSFLPRDKYTPSLEADFFESPIDRKGLIPALGIALSDNDYTPNFLFTYLEKKKKARARKTNQGIIAAGLTGLMLCTGAWAWMNQIEKRELITRNAVEKELAVFSATVTQERITEKIAQAKKKADMIRRYADDYIGLAVINEICTITPEHILLSSLEADFRKAPKKEAGLKQTRGRDRARADRIKIEGMVSSDTPFPESSLTGYMIALKDSPLFDNVKLIEKKREQEGPGKVLRFSADMEIR